MASQTFNVGIIGYGLSAKIFHIPFIASTPGLALHSIVQRSPQPGNSAPLDHPSVRHYSSADDLLADPAVHAVVITTPPDTHFALAQAALAAGKHVLAEKPFVPSAAQADALAALARREGRLLCVYQNRRWDADFLLLRRLVRDGSLGRVLELDSHFDRYRAAAPASWKGALAVSSGGSALFDLGTHLVDQAYVLFGLPCSVHGRLLSQRGGGGKPLDLENPDAVVAQLAYPDGLLVNVRISSLSAETRQPRFWARGSRGSFRTFGLDPQEDQLKAGMSPTSPGFGETATAPDTDTDSSGGGGNMKLVLVEDEATGRLREAEVPRLEPETYRAFYRRFADALASGRAEDVPVKAEEARDVLRIIEAVVESAKTGRDVILE